MWREQLVAFGERFEHPAWGISHSRRLFRLCLDLAGEQGLEVDEELFFAASHIHDIGAFAPYREEGADHAERSVQVLGPILTDMGFPAEKIAAVGEMVQGHMYYATPTTRAEAVIFHDADTLDFLGVIGITRILSIVGRDHWAPDVRSAVQLIRRFSEELPPRLITEGAKRIGKARQAEMLSFCASLEEETYAFETL